MKLQKDGHRLRTADDILAIGGRHNKLSLYQQSRDNEIQRPPVFSMLRDKRMKTDFTNRRFDELYPLTHPQKKRMRFTKSQYMKEQKDKMRYLNYSFNSVNNGPHNRFDQIKEDLQNASTAERSMSSPHQPLVPVLPLSIKTNKLIVHKLGELKKKIGFSNFEKAKKRITQLGLESERRSKSSINQTKIE